MTIRSALTRTTEPLGDGNQASELSRFPATRLCIGPHPPGHQHAAHVGLALQRGHRCLRQARHGQSTRRTDGYGCSAGLGGASLLNAGDRPRHTSRKRPYRTRTRPSIRISRGISRRRPSSNAGSVAWLSRATELATVAVRCSSQRDGTLTSQLRAGLPSASAATPNADSVRSREQALS
jgi:hypothetical protein